MFTDQPYHDHTSHGADAFRYLAMSWRSPKTQEVTQTFEQKLMTGAMAQMTFGKLKQEHLKKMRNKRNEFYH